MGYQIRVIDIDDGDQCLKLFQSNSTVGWLIFGGLLVGAVRLIGAAMAPVIVDPAKVREFAMPTPSTAWLADNHDKADELWIKIHKVNSGLPSITAKEAIDVVLVLGLDRRHPQGLRRKELPPALHATRPQKHLEQDQCRQCRTADRGRPDDGTRACPCRGGQGGRALGARLCQRQGHDPLPDDLIAAIEAEPAASAMLEKLSAQNRFALAFRLHNIKTEAGRRKKVETFVAMLARGETIYPQKKK
jgi:hypothetical protein